MITRRATVIAALGVLLVAAIGVWWLGIKPGASEAGINPTFTPSWSTGDRWLVQSSSILYSIPGEAGGIATRDVGDGPVYTFEVLSTDPPDYRVSVSSTLNPD